MARERISGEVLVDAGIMGTLTIDYVVMYSPATPDKWYMPNGDPGYPGDPEELEVLEAKNGVVDLLPLLQDEPIFHEAVLDQIHMADLLGG